MAIVFANLARETTSTVGTGNTFTLLGAVADYLRFADEVPNGALVYYTRRGTGTLFETAWGTFNATTHQITPVTGIDSSSTLVGGAFVPIAWTGTQEVYSAPAAQSLITKENSGATGLTLLEAATVAAARATLQLEENRVTLSSGQSGGTVGKFVRLTSADTWVDASQADTNDQLALVAFKESASLYVLSGRISISGLTAAVPYYLGTAGAATPSAPTPSGSVRRLTLGAALSTTEMLFRPAVPIEG